MSEPTPEYDVSDAVQEIGEDVEPLEWVDANYPWLSEWIKFVPATNPNVDVPLTGHKFQRFKGYGRRRRNKQLLTAAVFGVESEPYIEHAGRTAYTFPGFVQQVGRLPVQGDVVWIVYLDHRIQVVGQCTEDPTEYYDGLYRIHVLH